MFAKKSVAAICELDSKISVALAGHGFKKAASSTPLEVGVANQHCKSSVVCWTQAIVYSDSHLRRFGFYGSFTRATHAGSEQQQFQVKLGFKLPTWLTVNSIDVIIEFSRLSAQEVGINISRGEIKLQNRVPDGSSWMIACKNGDVKLMKQHLLEGTGSLRDKTTSTGSTPLLVGRAFSPLRTPSVDIANLSWRLRENIFKRSNAFSSSVLIQISAMTVKCKWSTKTLEEAC